MRASEFIREAEVKPYSVEFPDTDAAMAVLNSHCKEALQMITCPLWRGMRNHSEPWLIIDSSTGERKSQNTSNHYTIAIDTSPYFAGWPKRSKSLVCTTNEIRAGRYSERGREGVAGALYAVFPTDGLKIAICYDQDIWDTPVCVPEFGIDSDCIEDLNEYFNDQGISDNIAAMQPYLPILHERMKPENLGMQLMTITQYAHANLDLRETWVSGKVVCIRQDIYNSMLQNYTR